MRKSRFYNTDETITGKLNTKCTFLFLKIILSNIICIPTNVYIT